MNKGFGSVTQCRGYESWQEETSLGQRPKSQKQTHGPVSWKHDHQPKRNNDEEICLTLKQSKHANVEHRIQSSSTLRVSDRWSTSKTQIVKNDEAQKSSSRFTFPFRRMMKANEFCFLESLVLKMKPFWTVGSFLPFTCALLLYTMKGVGLDLRDCSSPYRAYVRSASVCFLLREVVAPRRRVCCFWIHVDGDELLLMCQVSDWNEERKWFSLRVFNKNEQVPIPSLPFLLLRFSILDLLLKISSSSIQTSVCDFFVVLGRFVRKLLEATEDGSRKMVKVEGVANSLARGRGWMEGGEGSVEFVLSVVISEGEEVVGNCWWFGCAEVVID